MVVHGFLRLVVLGGLRGETGRGGAGACRVVFFGAGAGVGVLRGVVGEVGVLGGGLGGLVGGGGAVGGVDVGDCGDADGVVLGVVSYCGDHWKRGGGGGWRTSHTAPEVVRIVGMRLIASEGYGVLVEG